MGITFHGHLENKFKTLALVAEVDAIIFFFSRYCHLMLYDFDG